MLTLLLKNTFFLTLFLAISCGNGENDAFLPAGQAGAKANTPQQTTAIENSEIIVGANRTELYIPLLTGKRVGVVTNQSGLIFKSHPHTKKQATHLVDSLLNVGIHIEKVYSPEHGFRGNADAGENVKDEKDPKTGLPIISLHGKNKKPTQEQLDGIDVLVFDIQDVGVRFYTYISTLTYVMEAAAEKGVPVIVLDRPNPNAHYIDGPTLEPEHRSFLGMHPIPLVYGMTIGEYAQMVNGQKWLKNGVQCNITVVPLKNWTRETTYDLPTRPSPNLPNAKAINLYPSLGFFEGTTINAGRGTEMQFQIFGSPFLPKENYGYTYTPAPNFGSKAPKENGNLCNGLDLRDQEYMATVNLKWLVDAYTAHTDKENFFKTKSFTRHAGTETLQKQIEAGATFTVIKKVWSKDIDAFIEMRTPYLIYD